MMPVIHMMSTRETFAKGNQSFKHSQNPTEAPHSIIKLVRLLPRTSDFVCVCGGGGGDSVCFIMASYLSMGERILTGAWVTYQSLHH